MAQRQKAHGSIGTRKHVQPRLVHIDGRIEAAVGKNGTLGFACGAGSVYKGSYIVGTRRGGTQFHFCTAFGRGHAPQLYQRCHRERHIVAGIRLDIGIDSENMLQGRTFGGNLPHSPVLGGSAHYHRTRRRIVEDKAHLLGAGSSINGHGHSPVAETGEVGEQNLGTVGSEHRHHVAGFYSYGLESIGNGVDIGAEIAPRRGLGAGSAGAVEIDTREDLAVGAVNFRAVACKIGEYIGHK